jgi:hypothetical protein
LAQGDAVKTVPCVEDGDWGDVEVPAIRSEERTGWMLKYPAVKSQRAPVNVGDWDRRRKIPLTAGNSVELSGFKRGVNWATGYTKVWLEVDGRTGLLSYACMSGFKTVDE